jgi:predicted O-methyltransferase YrrM
MIWDGLPETPQVEWDDTSVTREQMKHLLKALSMAEGSVEGVVVEVGSYRGETTRCLANATKRKVIAVDPYQGYGGAEHDFERFRSKVGGLGNVLHERKTSGEASRGWSHGPACFVFIDAVHDYDNTSFDVEAWLPKLRPGGLLALHDVDQSIFAGTRRAAFELSRRLELAAHPDNLAIYRVR